MAVEKIEQQAYLTALTLPSSEDSSVPPITLADAVRRLGVDFKKPGQRQDYRFRSELAQALSPSEFRREGLSGQLNIEFEGDIPRVVATSYPNPVAKPLLGLDTPQPWDVTYLGWQEREEEIEGQIRRENSRPSKYVLVGHGGEPLDTNRARSNNRKTAKFYHSVQTFQKRRPLERIQDEEAKDEYFVIKDFIQRGDTVCKLLGGYEPSTLLWVLGRAGKEGRVYDVSPASHLRERIFNNIFRLMVNFRRIKGEELRPQWYAYQEGMHRYLKSVFGVKDVGGTLASAYSEDLDFYQSGFADPAVLAQIRENFYAKGSLVPVESKVPPLPSQLRSGSVDTVLEMDRLTTIDEGDTEEMLWEIDRVLKPGGSLLIREDSRTQTEIEYYGQGLLDRDYKRADLPHSIKHKARWMAFRKTGGNRSFLVSKVEGSQKSVNTPNLGDLVLQIQSAQRESNGTGPDFSLTFFKSKGLLPILMTSFNGSIEDAVAFALNRPTKPETVIVEGLAHQLDSQVPNDAKSFYTEQDIAKEFRIKVSDVRGILQKSDIKPAGSNNTRKSAQARVRLQMRFSYQEYQIIKRMIQESKKA